MWPYIIAAAVGGAIAWSTQPKTGVRKRLMIGGRTGTEYSSEEFSDVGVLVLHANDGTVASFESIRKHPNSTAKKYKFLRGLGSKKTMRGMALDLGCES